MSDNRPSHLRRLALPLALLMLVQTLLAAAPLTQGAAAQGPVAKQPAGAPALTPLASVLNPDGTLRDGVELSGSVDTTGYQMQIDADGAPRFVREGAEAQQTAAGDGAWRAMPSPTEDEQVARRVWAMTLIGDDLYVGGEFTTIGGIRANSIARWSRSTGAWAALGPGLLESQGSSPTPAKVFTMVQIGRELYVGGIFRYAGDVSLANIARWNLDTGTWLSLNGGASSGTFSYSAVKTIVAGAGSDIYVGGNFTSAGTARVDVDNLARWDRSTGLWSAVGGGVGGNGSSVNALLFLGEELFVAGHYFLLLDGEISSGLSAGSANIAIWNTRTGTWSGLNEGLRNCYYDCVNAMAVAGDEVFVAGNFREAGGGVARGLARWNRTSQQWSPVGGGLGLTSGNIESLVVSAVTILGDDLIVAGNFTSAAGLPVKNVARWNRTSLTWSAVGEGLLSDATPATKITAIIPDGGGLLAAGSFLKQPGIRHINVAQWTPETNAWREIHGYERYRDTPLGSILAGGAGSFQGSEEVLLAGQEFLLRIRGGQTVSFGMNRRLDGPLYAVAASGDSVFVGGAFTGRPAEGALLNNVAFLTYGPSSVTSYVVIPLGSGTNGPVDALAVDGPLLYVGGRFSQADGASVGNIARYNKDTAAWAPLGAGVNGDVYAIAVSGSDVYVGGKFTQAGGAPASNIARWDSVAQAWSPVGGGVGGPVEAITVVDGLVYVGGRFTTANGVAARGLAVWNGETWREIGGGVRGDVRSIAHARDVRGDFLYVGGAFDLAGDLPASNIARIDRGTERWEALDVGADGPVEAIAVAGTNVIVGGQFDRAGGLAGTARLARYTFNPIPRLTSIAPPEGPNNRSTPVVVRGSGFGSSPQVFFRDAELPVDPATANDTQLSTTIPPDLEVVPCDYSLSVRNRDFEVGSRSFRVLASGPPTLFTPTPISASRGQPVTINGRNIVCGSTVRIGGALAGYSLWYDGWTLLIPPSLPDGTYDLSISGPNGTTTIPAAVIVGTPSGPIPVDVTISLHSSPAGQQRAPYEAMIRSFADGVFEQSNGAHRLRTVTFYPGGGRAGVSDIQWIASCWPNAHISGRSLLGMRVEMCDQFGSTDFLTNPVAGGYTLAHEWGHYYYSLYDEYRGDDPCDQSRPGRPCAGDTPVFLSIMNSQWEAVTGSLMWLNFSVDGTDTFDTAQHRIYAASGWATLTRPVSEDPRTGVLSTYPSRIFRPELADLGPFPSQPPQFDLVPNHGARAVLQIVWAPPEPALAAGDEFIVNLHVLGGTQIVYPQPLQVLATLQREQMVAGAVVRGELVTPDDNVRAFAMRDDGVAPDRYADDGIYAGMADYQQDGPHTVRVRFDNSAGRAREVAGSEQLTPPPPGETPAPPAPRLVGAPFAAEAELDIRVSGVRADDHGDTAAAATALPLDNVDVGGRVDRPGDRDLFRITPSGGAVAIRVTGLALGMRPQLTLLGPDGALELARVDLDSSQSEEYVLLTYQPQGQGSLFLAVTHLDAQASGGLYAISAGAPLGSEVDSESLIYLPLLLR